MSWARKSIFQNCTHSKVLERLQLCFFKAFPQKAAFFHRNLFSPSSSFLTLSVYLEKFCISPKIKMQLPYFCIFHDAKLTDYFTQTFYFPSSEDRVFFGNPAVFLSQTNLCLTACIEFLGKIYKKMHCIILCVFFLGCGL